MSNQQWFYIDAADDQQGPITSKKLQVLANSDTIKPETLVWTEEIDEKWIAARNVTGLFSDKPMQPPARPPKRPQSPPPVPPVPATPTVSSEPSNIATPLASAFLENTHSASPAIRASAAAASPALLTGKSAATTLITGKPRATGLLTPGTNVTSANPVTVPLLRAGQTISQPPQVAQTQPAQPAQHPRVVWRVRTGCLRSVHSDGRSGGRGHQHGRPRGQRLCVFVRALSLPSATEQMSGHGRMPSLMPGVIKGRTTASSNRKQNGNRCCH